MVVRRFHSSFHRPLAFCVRYNSMSPTHIVPLWQMPNDLDFHIDTHFSFLFDRWIIFYSASVFKFKCIHVLASIDTPHQHQHQQLSHTLRILNGPKSITCQCLLKQCLLFIISTEIDKIKWTKEFNFTAHAWWTIVFIIWITIWKLSNRSETTFPYEQSGLWIVNRKNKPFQNDKQTPKWTQKWFCFVFILIYDHRNWTWNHKINNYDWDVYSLHWRATSTITWW